MAKYEVTLTRSHFYTIEVEATDEIAAENAAWDALHTRGTGAFDSDSADWEDTAYVEEID